MKVTQKNKTDILAYGVPDSYREVTRPDVLIQWLRSEDLTLNKVINILAYGVTGNTSDFGSEESRFEP